MPFASAVKQELRNTLGPAWISMGVQVAIVALGLVVVVMVGAWAFELAQDAIVTPFEGMME